MEDKVTYLWDNKHGEQMKNQAHTTTRKITCGFYEVEHCPADSNVYTSFQVFNIGSEWEVTNEGMLCFVANSKAEATSLIKAITRSQAPYYFQD